MKITTEQIKQWSSKFKNWYYQPNFVVSSKNIPEKYNIESVDCAFVYQIENTQKYYMFVTGFDKIGYQTFTLESSDLLNWNFYNIAMSYGKKDSYDFGGVTFGGALFKSYDLNAPRILKKKDGKYWVLYGCYPKQGGYELRPGAEGLASSSDGLTWQRYSDDIPILSVNGAEDWEKDCIYQPWLIEHNNLYYNFYNAANSCYEKIGIATSEDLVNWQRYEKNPVIGNGEIGSYNEIFSSDGKVFYDGDHWVMLFFGVGKNKAHIMVAYSLNLIDWVHDPEPLYIAGGNPSGLDETYAHKISLVFNQQNDTYYMYYCAVGNQGRGIGLLTSKKI